MYIYDYKIEELGYYRARKFADKEMLYLSNKYNKNKFDNYFRYFAVRILGGIIY
jgi:hypothetical protein